MLSVLLVPLLATGCGASSTEAGQEVTDTSADYVADFDVLGGSGPEAALLSEIVAKTRPPELRSVSIGPIADDAVPAGADAETVPETKWLTFEYTVGDKLGAVVEAFWRGAVAATGYRRAAEERGLPLIRGYTIRSRTADGELVQDEVAIISSTAFEWDGKPASTDVEPLRARLSEETSASVEVLSLEVAEPGGAAPVITLETSDPQATLDDDKGELRFVGRLSMYEGYMVRLVDPNGELVWIRASANRAGAAMSWVRADLRSPL